MGNRTKNGQAVKVGIFLFSIVILCVSVTYAFITYIMVGTKKQVITAGVLSLELKEQENVLLENALPIHDEVGITQKPFTFQLKNNGDASVEYNILLRGIEKEHELVEDVVRYHFVKDGVASVYGDSLANLQGGYDINHAEALPREEYRKDALTFCKNVLLETEQEITEEECVRSYSEIVDSEIDFGFIIDYYILYLIQNEELGVDPRVKAMQVCKAMGGSVGKSIETEEECVELLKEFGEDIRNFNDVVKEYLTPEELETDSWYINRDTLLLNHGTIAKDQTFDCQLRLWIDQDVQDEEQLKNKMLSYKIEVEVLQKTEKLTKNLANEVFEENLGMNCETYDDGVDTFLIGKCNKNYVWYSGKLW